jgi:hypothetical protein
MVEQSTIRPTAEIFVRLSVDDELVPKQVYCFRWHSQHAWSGDMKPEPLSKGKNGGLEINCVPEPPLKRLLHASWQDKCRHKFLSMGCSHPAPEHELSLDIGSYLVVGYSEGPNR